jgi:hypothetical protein
MRRSYPPAVTARALDEIVFQASLHALLTAVGQLEQVAEIPPDVPAMAPVPERMPR